MYALAEALILTAVGLVVAILGVMCFNHYSRRLKIERERVRIIQDLVSKNTNNLSDVMAFSNSDDSEGINDINITPFVDVVLVPHL